MEPVTWANITLCCPFGKFWPTSGSKHLFSLNFTLEKSLPNDDHMTQEKKFLSSFPVSIVYLKSRLVTLTLSNSVMAAWWYAFVVLLFSGISVVVSGKCPCEDPSLCDTISRPPGKEFLMFSTKPNDWRKYDWGKVTTIALFRPWDDELMCEAHKRVSVGAIYLIDFPWSFLNLQKK